MDTLVGGIAMLFVWFGGIAIVVFVYQRYEWFFQQLGIRLVLFVFALGAAAITYFLLNFSIEQESMPGVAITLLIPGTLTIGLLYMTFWGDLDV